MYYESLNFFLILKESSTSRDFFDETENPKDNKMSETICLDQICYLKYHYVSQCFEFFQSNDSSCVTPCKVDACPKTVHYDYLCPMWFCEPLPTTTGTSTSTSTSLTTVSTSALTTSYDPDEESSKLKVSFAFNLFFCILFCIFFVLCKRAIASGWRNCCHHFRAQFQSAFRSNLSSENENIPLQQRNSVSTLNTLLENQQRSRPQNVNNENEITRNQSINQSMYFSAFSNVSESEEGSPVSGFSEIMLNSPDRFETALEEQLVSSSPATITTESASTAASTTICEKPKVSFLRKTLMRAAKKNKTQNAY